MRKTAAAIASAAAMAVFIGSTAGAAQPKEECSCEVSRDANGEVREIRGHCVSVIKGAGPVTRRRVVQRPNCDVRPGEIPPSLRDLDRRLFR